MMTHMVSFGYSYSGAQWGLTIEITCARGGDLTSPNNEYHF